MILWELVPWFSRCGLCMRRQLPTWLLAPVLDVALLIQLPVNDLGKQQKNMQVFGPLRSHGRPSISSRLQIDSAPTVEAIWQVNQPVVGRSLCLSLFLSNLQFRIENKIWNYEIVERKYGKAKMFMLALLFFFFFGHTSLWSGNKSNGKNEGNIFKLCIRKKDWYPEYISGIKKTLRKFSKIFMKIQLVFSSSLDTNYNF